MENRVTKLEQRTNKLEQTVTEHSVKLEHHNTIFEDLKTTLKELAVNVQMNNNLLEKRNAVDNFIWKTLAAIATLTGLLVAIFEIVN